MSVSPRLRVEGLCVRHGAAGHGFELRVDALALRGGEILAILGPNGAGKTTLLQAMAELLPVTRGSVIREDGCSVAMVFQRPVMLRGSAAYNVRVPLWPENLSRHVRARRVRDALARFGIEALAERHAGTLSGGELRRVALAQAFVREPAALLLDEPFDDLDAQAQESLTLDLRRIIHETGVALALVTHDLRHALLLADRIAVLCAGRLVQNDRRDAVLRRPATAEVARLVGMSNLFPARVRGSDAGGGAILEVAPDVTLHTTRRARAGEQVLVGVRPEHLKVDVGRGDSPTVGKARVRRVLSDGVLVTLWLEWAGMELRTIGIPDRGLGHHLREGEMVSFSIRPEDVHLLPLPGAAPTAAVR